ncbi:MAG: sulfite exporter TauE/SafE family protein [Planctomycetota bacterium]
MPSLLALATSSWFAAPPGVTQWVFVTALVTAAVVLGLGKSGFAGSIGIIAVPMTANVLPTDVAVGVLLPVLIVGDVFAAVAHWRSVGWQYLRWMILGSLPGVLVGLAILWWLGGAGVLTRVLNLVVGGLCLVIVGLQVWRMTGRTLPRIPPTANAGYGVGAASGVASTLAHSAGPIASIYLLEQQLDKARLVATSCWFFLLLNCIKVPGYVGLGLINPATLKTSAWMAVAVPVGGVIGLWLHKRIAEKPFQVVVYTGAALAAARMIYKGLT